VSGILEHGCGPRERTGTATPSFLAIPDFEPLERARRLPDVAAAQADAAHPIRVTVPDRKRGRPVVVDVVAFEPPTDPPVLSFRAGKALLALLDEAAAAAQAEAGVTRTERVAS
jgi:hypothetical protein